MTTTVFEKYFYKAEAGIYSVKKDDYNGTESRELLEMIKADIQPYSGGLADKEYGFSAEVTARMFCGFCSSVKAGNYVLAAGKTYLIRYVQEWNMGMEVLLDEDTNRRYGGA